MTTATTEQLQDPAPEVRPVLDVRGLTVSFATETGTVSAVDRVDLSLAPGEIVGIVGESGCGKSVTAMSLAGLLPRSARVGGSARLERHRADRRQATRRCGPPAARTSPTSSRSR